MNNPDDLARQKRDHEEQIFRDQPASNAEMKQTPLLPIEDALDYFVRLATDDSATASELERYSKRAGAIVDLRDSRSRLLAQNEALRKALEFIQSISQEELPHCKVGQGHEVAMRHIERKAREAIVYDKEVTI